MPPDTDIHASAYANGQPNPTVSLITSRVWVRQASSARRVRIAWCASRSDGLDICRRDEKPLSKPSPPSTVVSQCQASNRSEGAFVNAFSWSAKTSNVRLASSSGSLIRPLLSPPSW